MIGNDRVLWIFGRVKDDLRMPNAPLWVQLDEDLDFVRVWRREAWDQPERGEQSSRDFSRKK
jgi:hypothetical protein